MQITELKIRYFWLVIFILAPALLWVLSSQVVATAGYADSAHGNTSYGANRSGTGYQTGDCAHCHDTFDQSICGNTLMLFEANDAGFCVRCHDNTTDPATTAIVNRSYSYRAGGWTADTVDDIDEAFSLLSSHSLSDISTFIGTPGEEKWGYTADSNPCTACHNPHPAQRDLHTASSRGWLVSLPSSHTDTSTWQLWGDDAGERMDEYSTYQAPNATSGYEPDGSTTQDGSNLTDYVTFCTDCHNVTNDTTWSTTLSDYLKTIDWTTEKHGRGAAGDCAPRLLLPYQEAQCGSYVLACTDCHEPHGAPNIFLTREKVNNGDVTVLTGTGYGPDGRANKEWVYLCGKCHDGLLKDGIHTHPWIDLDGDGNADCIACHIGGGTYYACGKCHYHGNRSIDGVDYGEPLF